MSKDVTEYRLKKLEQAVQKLMKSAMVMPEMFEIIERRLNMLEGVDEDGTCTCGKNHDKELIEMIGHIVNIEFTNDKAGPWFFVMSAGDNRLFLQELTHPDKREKIGDPRWVELNEITRITMERSL